MVARALTRKTIEEWGVAHKGDQGGVDGAAQWGRLLIALLQWGCSKLHSCHTAAVTLLLQPVQSTWAIEKQREKIRV